MTPKPLKVRSVDRQRYTVYLNRAHELYAAVQHAEQLKHWASVGVNAVHCAIALNDAVTVYCLGQRSAGESHAVAAELLYKVDIDGAVAQSRNFSRILAKKTAVDYEDREFRQSDAQDMLKQIERFYEWGVSNLPEAPGA